MTALLPTRYCKYGELAFIRPCFWNEGSKDLNSATCFENLVDTVKKSENAYRNLINEGATPEQARAILPNSLKTEIVMTANLREWRHILKLRASKKAHPQMRQIAFMILDALKKKLPVVFSDIA